MYETLLKVLIRCVFLLNHFDRLNATACRVRVQAGVYRVAIHVLCCCGQSGNVSECRHCAIVTHQMIDVGQGRGGLHLGQFEGIRVFSQLPVGHVVIKYLTELKLIATFHRRRLERRINDHIKVFACPIPQVIGTGWTGHHQMVYMTVSRIALTQRAH